MKEPLPFKVGDLVSPKWSDDPTDVGLVVKVFQHHHPTWPDQEWWMETLWSDRGGGGLRCGLLRSPTHNYQRATDPAKLENECKFLSSMV